MCYVLENGLAYLLGMVVVFSGLRVSTQIALDVLLGSLVPKAKDSKTHFLPWPLVTYHFEVQSLYGSQS